MIQTKGRGKGWTLAVLLTGQFMANVDTAIVNVASPSIQTSLHASGAELELVVSGYLLAYAMLLITGARLGDLFGCRRAFLAGIGVFTAASLACGMAPNAVVLIVVRVVQGAGAALLVPQVLSGIQQQFFDAERARALGLYTAALSGGAVAGQALGGVLISADLFGSAWRSVFLINVPVGAALLAVAMRELPTDTAGAGQRLDLRGVATLSVAVLLAVLPLILGRDQGWPTWTWASLAGSIPAFVGFLIWERRVAANGGSPLVNLHALARSAVAWALGAQAAATCTYLSLLFTLALYLQRGLGESPLASGLALVSWVSAFGVAGLVLRRIPAFSAALAAPAGNLLLAASYFGIAISILAGSQGGALLIVLLGCGGFGLGTGFSALVTHLTTAVPARFAADLSGVFTTVSQIAGVVGVAGYGTVYFGLAPAPGPRPAMHAFAAVTLACAATALLAAFASQRATRRQFAGFSDSARPEASERAAATIG